MGKGWRTTTLGEIADVYGGGTPSTKIPSFWGGEVPWITPTEVVAQDGKTISKTERTITQLGLDRSGARLMPSGSVLVTSRATVGAVALAGVPIAINQGFAGLLCHEDVLPEWLLLWCQANRNAFRSRAGGSTFPEVSRSVVRTIPLSVPSPKEQRRTVDLIAALDTQLTASERLATSAAHLAAVIFEAAAAHMELRELDSVLDAIDAGRSPLTYGRRPQAGERGVLKVSAVQPGAYVASESKAVDGDVVLDSRWEVRAGDVLMTRANTPERVGAVCRVTATPPALYLSDKTLRLVPVLERVDPDFLVIAIGGRRSRAQLSAGATGTSASMFNISQAKIREVRIPLPPLEVQRSLVAEVSAAQSTAAAACAVTQGLERLRRSMLQDLLSGRHEIPPSYDRLLEAVS